MKKMKYWAKILVLCAVFLIVCISASSPAYAELPHTQNTSSALLFIENVGQFDPRVRFQLRSSEAILWITDDALWVTVWGTNTAQTDTHSQHSPESVALPSAMPSAMPTSEGVSSGVNVRLSFPESNPQPYVEAFQRQTTQVSYFIGNDSAQWRADVPVWGGVRYRDLYPGVDLEIRSAETGPTFYLVTHTPTTLEQVRLRVEGVDTLEIVDGQLQLTAAESVFALPLLMTEMPINNHPGVAESAGVFEVGFPFTAPAMTAAQNTAASMDNLLFSTFLGGAGEDWANAAALDAAGNIYVVGATLSVGFPTTPGAFDRVLNDKDTFVLKLDPTGAQLHYATFIGGSHIENGYDIALDATNSAYIVGWTQSTDFPVTHGAFDTTFGGGECNIGGVYPLPCPDAFVVKLNASGTALLYATYLGGNRYDRPYAISLDNAGNTYIMGSTRSENFPTTPGAFDTSYNGHAEYNGYWYGDVFVTKLNATGSALFYSTYLGGSSYDGRWGDIALLPNGDVIVVGMTGSTDFPVTAGALDTTHNGGADVYVTRLNAHGSALVYSTFIGGSADEHANDAILDASGNAYVSGWTCSADFPTTANAYQPAFGGRCDAFVIKISPTGNALPYATFLGGDQNDSGLDINLSENGQVYLVGRTNSPGFPTTVTALDHTWNGDYDGFLAALDLNRHGSEQLVYATFLGGNAEDHPVGVHPSGGQTVVVVGSTQSADFPVTAGAYDTTFNGVRDGFVAKILMPNPAPRIHTLDPAWRMVRSSGFTLTVNGEHFLPSSVVRWNGNTLPTQFVNGGRLRATVSSNDLLQAGYIAVMVFTPGPGGGASNVSQFAVHQIAPSLSAITPEWAAANGDGFVLTASGINFVPESVVRWNGAARPTTFINHTQVQAHISAADISVAGEASITVFTPPPGGGLTHPIVFTITDAYEPDDTCTLAHPIPTDGTVQQRTFHQQADADWVIFEATAGVQYRIEAQIPFNSPVDVTVELYDQCDGVPVAAQNYHFTPGVRLDFEAHTTGPIYLKWFNYDPEVYGVNAEYHISVRALATEPTPGAIVIVAGRLRMHDPLQPHIYTVTNQVRQLFMAHDYTDERIYYLATDLSLPGVDATATAANLQAAITTWAVDKVGPDRAFTLYIIDHGVFNQIYLDKPSGEWVTPAQLNDWLTQLEAARPGVMVNVIIEACHSGSFIHLPQTVSKPGRVVISSTGAYNLAYASNHGALFSDHFLSALGQGESLYAAFQTARWATLSARRTQTPWLDDNGNGIPNELTDGHEAARQGFAYVGTLTAEQWPPYIVQATGPAEITQGRGIIRAEVRDDEQVRRVWAVIYPPSYRPPESGEELISEALPTIVLQAQGNDQFAATYTGFDELGLYQVVIYAEDNGGREARPIAMEVRTGWGIYLPLVMRQ